MIQKRHISNLSNYWIAALFVMFFFIDFVSKTFVNISNVFIHTSVVFKAIFQLFIIVFALVNYDIKLKKLYFFLFILFLSFIAGNFFSLNNTHFIERIINNFKVFSWYMFPFFIIVGWFYIKKANNFTALTNNLFKAFELVFLINCIFIFIGLFFDISLFKAYPFGRFGFIGLLRNVSHSSYIFMIFVTYFLIKIKNKPIFYNYFLLLLSVFVCVVLATKAILLFLFLLLFFYTIKFSIKTSIAVLLVLSFIVYLNINNLHYILETYFPVIINVFNNKGLLTMLFSYRNISLTDCFLPYISDNWILLNYFFGGAEFNLFRTELELFDLFWFFGIFGASLYLYLFNNFFISFKNIYNVKPLFFIFFISLFAGSFFSSVPVMTFLFVLVVYIDRYIPYQKNVKNFEKSNNLQSIKKLKIKCNAATTFLIQFGKIFF